MEIHIQGNWYIRPDSYQWLLVEKVPSKPGSKREYTERVSCHANIQQCLYDVLNRNLGDVDSIYKLSEEIKNFKQHLANHVWPKFNEVNQLIRKMKDEQIQQLDVESSTEEET